MPSSSTGKEQKATQAGKLRIEWANDRIVIYNSSDELLVKIDENGFTIYDPATGKEISLVDSTGVSIFGQGFSIFDSVTRLLKGYLGYGIGGGDAVVLNGNGTGVTLFAGDVTTPKPIRLLGSYVKLPVGTSHPDPEGQSGVCYFNPSTDTLWIYNGTSWVSEVLT